MSWQNHFRDRQITAREAAAQIKSGDRVVAAHAGASPETILHAMVEQAEMFRSVEIVHMIGMGHCLYCRPEHSQSFRHNSFFAGASSRAAIHEGRADYTPCFFSEIPSLFRNGLLPVDAAVITVSPPDNQGYISLGISVDYTMQACRSAKLVIAEVNPNMPRTYGNSLLAVNDIDYFVPVDRPLLELPRPEIGSVEEAIGGHAASIINDGDCLQLGLGSIPDAVLSFLGHKKDIGIHSEMIADGVVDLVEKGVITCKAKNFRPGKIVISFALGTAQLYKWLHKNPMIDMQPVDYTNDASIIGRNDNMVAINSAISVDLLGQVAADTMGCRQFSAVGGQVDFVTGAARSKNGRSIIALPATAAKGSKSRIVVSLQTGQSVTTSRNNVDYVATEHGIVRLKGKTAIQRSKLLISIAAPEFREELEKGCRDLYGW